MLKQIEKNKIEDLNYHLRTATLDDLSAVVELLNTCAIDQTGAPDTNESLVKSEWTGPTFDLQKSVRVAETDQEEIVGYIEVWDTDPIPVSNWVWARVHPQFEGFGIGTALMSWAEKRLQSTVTRVPKDLQVSFICGTVSSHDPTKKLFESVGMKSIRYFWRMVADLDEEPPQPKWPEGITISSLAELGDLPAVFRASEDAFQDHFGHVSQPAETGIAEWEHWIATDDDVDPVNWFLALDGPEIAGVCLCRKREREDPNMGWINVLGVRRPWRRKGLGLAMLHYAFGRFYRSGKDRVGLGVDAQSITGATRLYARAGMHVAREYQDYEKILRHGRDIRRK